MNVTTISDTHSKHYGVYIPPNTDMIIHCGDATVSKNKFDNVLEMKDFLEWYNNLEIKYKIFVPGNHDTSVESNLIDFKLYPTVIVLNHQEIVIEGIKLFGSPYTPTFNTGWSFNKGRDKIIRVWEQIPYDTDILITHGPPQGILDVTVNRDGYMEQVGCSALMKTVRKINPKYHLFGHLHDEDGIYNTGTRQINEMSTVFVNACMVNLKYKLIHLPFEFVL